MTPARKNFALGVLYESLWGAGFTLINPVTMLPLALKELGGGPELAELMLALLFGGLNLLQLWASFYFGPRWSEPRWLALLHLPGISCVAGMALLFYFFPSMEPGLKLALFLGLSSGFYVLIGLLVPHWINMITRIVPEGQTGRYFGWSVSVANLLGIAAGFYGSRWISQGGMQWGYALCFGSSAALMLASTSVLFFLTTLTGGGEEPGELRPFLKKNWEHLSKNREVRVFLGFFLLMQLASSSSGLFTVCLKERGVATSWFGGYNAALSIGGLLGSFLMGWLADKRGARQGLNLAFAVFLCSIPFLIAPLAPAWALPTFFGGGFMGSAYPVLNLYLITKLAQPGRTAQFTGAFATATAPILILVPLIHGWLAGHISYTMSFSLSILACLGALFALRLLPSFGAPHPHPPLPPSPSPYGEGEGGGRRPGVGGEVT